MIAKCLKDLLSAGSLHFGDKLYFGDIPYQVFGKWLACTENSNSFIFTHLNINKYEVCKTIYGYEPVAGKSDGAFPEYGLNDFNAAYRIAIALFILYERTCNAKVSLSAEYTLSQLKSDVDRYCSINTSTDTTKAENPTYKSFVRLNESITNLKVVL